MTINKIIKTWLRIAFLGLVLLQLSCTEDKDDSVSIGAKDYKLFEQIPSSYSNVDFNNRLTEDVSTKFNLLDFDYFYNGAGVGIADLDNDGLQDIVFAGNQVENKIYKNLGDLKFEDKSATAGINTGKFWSNGVSFADVNQDGWLDIYICQGGPHEKGSRKNLLFINQKDLSFKESAEGFGLADDGLSTQAAFFDYDKDGDLDCIVMNESEAYGYDPITFNNLMVKNKELLNASTSRLYENVNGKYKDVTEQAGLLRPSFGLGLVVSDINNDGWLDIYISNDYYIPDAMYINQKNGKFKDRVKQNTSQISMFGMGVDIADINKDGMQDIFVLDMASSDHYRSKTLMASMSTENFNTLVDVLKYPHQYMFNSLQINAGNNHFRNVAHQFDLGKTDWSWAGLMVDFDNDTDTDVFVSNGYRRYALDNDFKAKVAAAQNKYKGRVPLEIKKSLYAEMPEEPLANLIYENQDELNFKLNTEKWGLNQPSYSNGASVADLDNDGDLDLVVNNIDNESFIYKNNSSSEVNRHYLKVKLKGSLSESFAKVSLSYGGETQTIESKRVRGYFSSVDDDIIFGLGAIDKLDALTVQWLSGKSQTIKDLQINSTVRVRESEATNHGVTEKEKDPAFIKVPNSSLNLFYAHVENEYDDFEKEILLPYKQSTLGPFLTKGDINGDGEEDIFIGGAAGTPAQVFIQTDGSFVAQASSSFEADKSYEDMQATFVDIDQDNDLDLYVCSGGNAFEARDDLYRDRLYLNDGKGNFVRAKNKEAETNFNSKKAIHIDIDKDGDQDVIVGARVIPQHYPRPDMTTLLLNENGKLIDKTNELAPALSNFGIVNDLIATDFDQDGWTDIIAVGEWTNIGLFRNIDGMFEEVSSSYGLANLKGWFYSVTETDVNKDGNPDYIIGNIGKNTKFKASEQKPFKVFANDFDANGTFDVVLSNVYGDEYVPVRGKECSSQQMPFISEKFKSYDAFASASLVDIYGDALDSASEYEANTFESYLLLNENGKLIPKPLPTQAQSFPMLSTQEYDINKDGYMDIIAAGSIYNTEVETPRWDSGTGIVLLSNQKNGYEPMSARDAGLFIDGNVKSLLTIDVGARNFLLGGINSGLLSIHELKR